MVYTTFSLVGSKVKSAAKKMELERALGTRLISSLDS